MNTDKLKTLNVGPKVASEERFYLKMRAEGAISGAQAPHQVEPIEEAGPLPMRGINPDDLTGRTIEGRYQVERLLGNGGMGAVYLATHLELGQKCAIKVLHGYLTYEGKVVKRFLKEAQAAASIQSPHVIRVFDFGTTDDGITYMVMEYLEGKELADLLDERGRLPWREARDLLLQIGEGLKAAHEKQILHRDLKPSNIFLVPLSDGRWGVKIIDFGIAKILKEGDDKLTRTGTVLGTPEYMSPEQARGETLTPASDMYSLGVILFEMITGRLPFESDTYNGVLHMHLTMRPPRPSQVVGEISVPQNVERVIMNLLVKEPSGRPGTVASLMGLIQGISPEGGGRHIALARSYLPLWRRALVPFLLGLGVCLALWIMVFRWW